VYSVYIVFWEWVFVCRELADLYLRCITAGASDCAGDCVDMVALNMGCCACRGNRWGCVEVVVHVMTVVVQSYNVIVDICNCGVA
jgi:hypothetical protein